MQKDSTYSEAIEQVMRQNGGYAPLKILYERIWQFKDKSRIIGETPDKTIQERVQRDARFTRIAKGIYALADFIEKAEKEDLGFFTVENKKIVFVETADTDKTEKVAQQKVRIVQSRFRKNLLSNMKRCPVTGIDDSRILIASHIKPWVHSNNDERIDIRNGLILSPLFDKLFDKTNGLITFTLEKRILVSKKISEENVARLKISSGQTIESLDIKGREEFLVYHRKFIFQG